MKKYTAVFAAALLLLCACGKNEGNFPDITTVSTAETTLETPAPSVASPAETSAETSAPVTTAAETSAPVTTAAETSAVTTAAPAVTSVKAETTASEISSTLATSENVPNDTSTDIQYTMEPLSRKALITLLNEYADTKYTEERPITRNDVSVVNYYGTYDNGEVVAMTVGDSHTDDEKCYNIGEYEFILASGSYEMLLHTEVEFIEADEAYEQGLLTDEDAAKMYYYHEHQRDAELIPALLNPITGDLTDGQIDALRKDFAEYMRDIWSDITLDEIHILKYYGTYDGGEVGVMYSYDYAMTCDEKRIDIAGYEFYLESGSLEILLHTDGGFITAAEAYEQGLLSDDDIAEMHSHEGVYW